jgi:hypothetical protein
MGERMQISALVGVLHQQVNAKIFMMSGVSIFYDVRCFHLTFVFLKVILNSTKMLLVKNTNNG